MYIWGIPQKNRSRCGKNFGNWEKNINLPFNKTDYGKKFLLFVRLIPNAPRNEIVGWHGEKLKIRLQASPVKEKANKALVRFLAKIFKLHSSQILLKQGLHNKNKVLEIRGLSEQEFNERCPS